MSQKQITAAELRELLEDIPDDALVETEGCDCIGEANGVEYDEESNTVLIRRPDGVYP